jgi:hypothetical protein
MKHSIWNSLIFATAGSVVLSVPALAASPPTNVRGTIAQIDGNTIEIKERDGGVAKVHLADNAKIVSVAKSSLSRYQAGKLYWHCGNSKNRRKTAGHRSPYFPRVNARDRRRKPRVGSYPKE